MYYSVYYYLHCINRKDKLYINLLKMKFLIQTNSKLIHINACGIFYFYFLSLGCPVKYYQNDVDIANINLGCHLLGVSYSRDKINIATMIPQAL